MEKTCELCFGSAVSNGAISVLFWLRAWDGVEPSWTSTVPFDERYTVLCDEDIVFGEDGDTVVITKFSNGHQ